MMKLWIPNKCSIINMFRGDSLDIPLDIRNGSVMNYEQYNLTDNDTVYFGLMEPNQKFEDAILKKVLTISDIDNDGNLIVKLEPIDTVDLLPGKYYYSIKLKQNSDNSYDVYTLLKETEFWILN